MSEKNFWEGYQQEPVKPAQQEPKIDIYRSFEQWKSGNVLEHGVPRTEHYSEAQLDLVEMGWNYGYDAGRAVEQALDKKAENARELGLDYEPAQQEPVAYLVDDDLYYPEEIDWESLKEQRHTVASLYTSPPAQRTWVDLTDKEILASPENLIACIAYVRNKLKEKNT
jgi:hypothetical protein